MENTIPAVAQGDNHALHAAKDIAYGSFAGMLGKVIEYPFDTIKVRLQSQPDHIPLRFAGPLDCLSQSIRSDGFTSLYRGISSPMVGAAVENAALFFSYNVAKGVIGSVFYPQLTRTGGELPIGALVVCGGISGAAASVLLTPIELVKCKMQVQALGQSDYRAATLARSTGTIPKTSTAAIHTASAPRYAGPITLAAEVVKVYGFKGLWRGQTGTLFRESGGSAAWFGAYEYVSRTLRKMSRRDTNTAGEMMLSGATAGVSYNFIFFPADTVKSRMQTEAVGLGTARKGFFEIGREVWHNGGLKALYRGCGITLARSAPSSAVIFLVYETMKSKF